MANRYANLPGAAKIKDTYDRINQGFDLVEQDVDQLRADLDQEIADREAAVEYVDQRVDNIIVGGGPDKDPELVDIRNLDPSYTPQREINVAGDVTRDMQARFAAHKAETVSGLINVKYPPHPMVAAKGDGVEDDTSALQGALDTGKNVFLPPGDYRITDTLKMRTEGQTLFGYSKQNTRIINDTNDKPLLYVGDPDIDVTGWARYCSIIGLSFEGNEQTTSGITLWSALSANPTWNDASKDCLIRDIAINNIGNGAALEVYSWSNDIENVTIYTGCKYGVITKYESNANNFNGLYITDCEEEGLIVGSEFGVEAGSCVSTSFLNTVVQKCGGARGAIDLRVTRAVSFYNLYLEFNSSPSDVFIAHHSRGADFSGVYKRGDGSNVIHTQGDSTSISNVVVNGDLSGSVILIDGSSHLTSTFIKNIKLEVDSTAANGLVVDSSDRKQTFYFGRQNVGIGKSDPLTKLHIYGSNSGGLDDVTVESFDPGWTLKDRGSMAVRGYADAGSFYVRGDADNDGTFEIDGFQINMNLPEMVVNAPIRPRTDNTRSLGTANQRWSTVYAATGTINTSDAREKQQIRPLSEAEKAVAKRIKDLIRAFKYNDAVDLKGEDARIHFGVIAQDIRDAFLAEGLDPHDYAMFCYDEWPEQEEVKDEEGNVVQEYVPAGNRYGIRYDELLAFLISTL